MMLDAQTSAHHRWRAIKVRKAFGLERLSLEGSRRQLSNCFAEACGYDSHNRQRGNDGPESLHSSK
jgi:hypothetical protein